MPIYQFINPSTLESVEVVQSMRDDHVYIDKDGLEWERVWEVPNAQIDSQINPEDKNAYLKTIPLGRWGKPEDVGNTVSYFASDEASFITGQTLCVNGGRTPW